MEFLAILVLIALLVLHFLYWPRISRAWIDRRPFPAHWQEAVSRALPFYTRLPPRLQEDLKSLINRFIARKQFIGCAGLQINDEIRVSIAAQACLLILNRESYEYESLRFIYVYPSSFRAVQEVRDEIGLVSTETRDLLGESWDDGKVILAWDEVERGARNFDDGYNVVMHEFAHQLDHESGITDGAPLLYTHAAYKSWAYVFGTEFEKLQNDTLDPGIIDDYGATDPAEFFAVATETFFEEPHRMYEHHRALFDLLKNYYHLDPRDWI